MASEIVQSWIQHEVKLSRLVQSFETDFSNGYLFGEILKQYNYISDMATFSKKYSIQKQLSNRVNKEAKVKNFQQVESVLRQLKVKFDAKLIHSIMNEERGAALRLLYQIKLAVQKESGVQTKTMTGLKGDVLNRKFEETMNLRVTLPGNANSLQTVHKSKKLEPIEKKMLPFEYKKKLLEDKAYRDQLDEEAYIRKLQQEQRQKNLKTMEENKTFMQEWEATGRQNWNQNLKKRQDTMDRQKYFEDKEVAAFKAKLNKELDVATQELMGGIDEFEKNLQKLGIEKNTNIEDAIKKMEEKKGVPPGQIQNFSYAATMNKIKEKKNVSDFAAKERDRRRRKMIVDQAKTQNNLDKQKNEELLIQKLMQKQQEEQKLAYLDRRNVQCKSLVLGNRSEKAMKHEEKKLNQMQELERKRNEEHERVIEQHKKEIQLKKKEYQEIRRQERFQKRQVHREICSEVMDLILDIANEAYDESIKSSNRKIQKPVWREWMGYFKENQLVSKMRKGANSQIEQFKQSSNDDTQDEDFINDPTKPLEDILDIVKYDSSYEDMMSYLTGSGMFNLNCGIFSEWNTISDLSKLEGLNFDFQFLDSNMPTFNPDLGQTLSNLLQNLWREDRTDRSYQTKIEGIPHHLTLKLCLLGKQLAGKKTIAKQLQDLYNGKIKVFKMEDIIKEVLDYVNPRPAIDPSAQIQSKKGGPPPKGKVEEPQFVDQYAGLDTREFREIGLAIKKHLEGNGVDISSNNDLVSEVTDESLLVRLFIFKLKLAYQLAGNAQDKPDDVKIEEIKQGLIKEKELLDQLAELEAQGVGAGGPQSKAAAKAPPKGKAGGPSNDEQIKQELEQIQKVNIEGWILLDFPRTLGQAKMMEKLMSGYTCMIDALKPIEQQKFEQWSKHVTPGATYSTMNDEIDAQQSAVDGFLLIDVPQDECHRRVQNRKIDPQTGTIYHLEDNPPPENDAKLRDRLQDYQDPVENDLNRVNRNHILYDENVNDLKKWFKGFALSNKEVPQAPIVNSMLEVQINQKKQKDEVLDLVLKQINQIIAFKQSLYDHKRQQVRESIKISLENQSQNDQQVAEVEETLQDNQHEINETNLSENQMISRLSKRSEMIPQKELNDDQKRDIWSLFENSYYRDCLIVFKQFRKQRENFLEGLNQIQTSFIDFLSRADQKQQMINDFIDSFNKFSEEFPDLRKDQQTQEELLKRVEKLNMSLWNVIEDKKDQAIDHLNKLQENGWVKVEMLKLIKLSCKIFYQEIQKYSTLIKIISSNSDNNLNDLNIENVFDGYVDDGVSMVSNDGGSPLIDKLVGFILKMVQYQNDQLHLLVSDSDKIRMLKCETQCLMYRINLIKTFITLKLQEFHSFSQQLFEMLDDWIIVAIMKENEVSQKVCQNITQCINQHYMKLDYNHLKLAYIDLDTAVSKIDFTTNEKLSYIDRMNAPNDVLSKRFKVNDLIKLQRDFCQQAYDEYLDASTFIHMIVMAYQEDRIPSKWKYYDFSAFNQVVRVFRIIPYGKQKEQLLFSSHSDLDQSSAEREFVDWRKICTAFILLQSNLGQYKEIEAYAQRLMEFANERG